jgi:C-terminal processing protease CtpA/Prc
MMYRVVLALLMVAPVARSQSASEVFCTEVLRYYPSEFVDQTVWWQTCQRTKDLNRLMEFLQDPLLRIVTELPACSDAYYVQNQISTTGYIRLTGFYGGEEFLGIFDKQLEKARYDNGLILDLRGAGGGEIDNANQVMARLTNNPLVGIKVFRRVPGEEKVVEKDYQIKPRGEWQFDLPVVIVVDSTTYWPSQIILWSAKQRTQMETVGIPSMGTKCVEPKVVTLPGGLKVQIPTATVKTADDVKLTGQSYEPDVNINKEPVGVYRDPNDPILYRGTDELYRIMGRLEWLRDEMRKQAEGEGQKSGSGK